jgi:hypothetical protein
LAATPTIDDATVTVAVYVPRLRVVVVGCSKSVVGAVVVPLWNVPDNQPDAPAPYEIEIESPLNVEPPLFVICTGCGPGVVPPVQPPNVTDVGLSAIAGGGPTLSDTVIDAGLLLATGDDTGTLAL